MKTIVFSRDRKINGWRGMLPGKTKKMPGKPLVFPEHDAAQVFEHMVKRYPKIRVGFRSEDLGPHIVRLYGPVLWMQSSGQQAA